MFFEKALDQPAHTGSGAFFLLPVYCPVLTEQIGQLFCNCNQFVMFVEVFDGLGLGQSIVECKLVGGQSQLFALCVCIGNFFGMLPEEMKGCKTYGVEIDPVSARLAKQLYQKAQIQVKGYEDTQFEDNFFDVAIGNVPFGNYKVYDRLYDKHNFMIHDYFFAKTLDKVRPGGIIAFVTISS